MMSSAASGFVLVQQVPPNIQPDARNAVRPAVNSVLQKFLQGEPKALGTVQIMIGVTVFLFGIVMLFNMIAVIKFSGIMFWAALIYISAGSIAVAADKNPNQCLVKASLAFNVISAIVAAIAVVLHSIDMIIITSEMHYRYYRENSNSYVVHVAMSNMSGITGVMIVFSLLEFIISICLSVFACGATCCSTDSQVVYIPHLPAQALSTPTASLPNQITSGEAFYPASTPLEQYGRSGPEAPFLPPPHYDNIQKF
ncbi:membrane-spanning 4-domains subfamily A member 4D-like [Denticeps clupeoides]|uniref:membrane-spanning 4-domains subfamily A member 4D-like n=1 Tax=Denticeps clupeoides TaxID=299321 RepID=UPI0010A52FD5|nr:membrane-spanning 4-domains subfamily A member 4D-like [Denticeps clupeoides]XP_028837722.1 membrane-spanning 4-domains subfamily A member 4D-like [Denticeps clupeoides]